MKYILTLVLSVLFLASFSGGDDSWNKRVSVDNYESNLNLQYFGIDDTIKYLDNKGKPRWFNATTNVSVYDISKDQISCIFKDTVKRVIRGFYFETKYFEEFKTIEFNNSYDAHSSYNNGLFSYSNNFSISQRPLSNNIIIVTEDVKGEMTTIWICDKRGNNLVKAFELSHDWNWEIDVKNQMVRISRQQGLKIEVKNTKY